MAEAVGMNSFRRLISGFHEGPPWGVLLGSSLEDYICGADSWGIFDVCLKLAPQEL